MHHAGDAVLAKFEAVVNAMSAAVAIQEELKTRNQSISDESRVEIRVGARLLLKLRLPIWQLLSTCATSFAFPRRSSRAISESCKVASRS